MIFYWLAVLLLCKMHVPLIFFSEFYCHQNIITFNHFYIHRFFKNIFLKRSYGEDILELNYMSTLPPSGIVHILKLFLKFQSLLQTCAFYFQKSCSLREKAHLIPKSWFMLNRHFSLVNIFYGLRTRGTLEIKSPNYPFKDKITKAGCKVRKHFSLVQGCQERRL